VNEKGMGSCEYMWLFCGNLALFYRNIELFSGDLVTKVPRMINHQIFVVKQVHFGRFFCVTETCVSAVTDTRLSSIVCTRLVLLVISFYIIKKLPHLALSSVNLRVPKKYTDLNLNLSYILKEELVKKTK